MTRDLYRARFFSPGDDRIFQHEHFARAHWIRLLDRFSIEIFPRDQRPSSRLRRDGRKDGEKEEEKHVDDDEGEDGRLSGDE